MKESATKEAFVDGDSGRQAPLAMDSATFRRLVHRLVDQLAGFLESLPLGPVTRDESPAAVRDALELTEPLPEMGTDLGAVAGLLTRYSTDTRVSWIHNRTAGADRDSRRPNGDGDPGVPKRTASCKQTLG
jgi:hypothetical protein